MTLAEFTKSRKHLFWSTRDYSSLSEEAVVETVLNYGDWADVKMLFAVLGLERVAGIFRDQTSSDRQRPNYRPEINHYFNLYFRKYA